MIFFSFYKKKANLIYYRINILYDTFLIAADIFHD